MHTPPAPLDADRTVGLLRSSRLARVAFTVDDEPFLVTAAVTVAANGRMTLEVDDPDACAHLGGRHIAIEVDGQYASTGARWSVTSRGTAIAKDDAASTGGRFHRITDAPGTEQPDPGRTFVVVPTDIVGHLLAGGAVEDWFAGVPAS
jgi:hypothetical protein